MRNIYFQPKTNEVELLPQMKMCIVVGTSGGMQSNAMAPRRLKIQ